MPTYILWKIPSKLFDFYFRCQFPSYCRQISNQKAKRNVTAKCSITENVQNVKSLHLYQKTSRRSEESKVKKEMYFLYNKRIYLPQFFSHIRSYPYIICVFPTFRIKMFVPLFCFLYYSLIFTVFNSIIPTLICEIFPELMDSQELEDNRPCNLNSSLKKL